ncbi:hypothetical Protein YC6258_05517 [Gynuella sunshinyii YC6258]|uniref:Uncharacterized protein n=1 Tax=Gynuella sunshinyii YC6258 TaxID=1445510 RepID=A0A0C5VE02_9GAMM|nr:hypothetical Protein YC6258_05517 [Gynuella sunshinyii YC6258]
MVWKVGGFWVAPKREGQRLRKLHRRSLLNFAVFGGHRDKNITVFWPQCDAGKRYLLLSDTSVTDHVPVVRCKAVYWYRIKVVSLIAAFG